MILVTGGTGLVGSQLIFDLVSSGKKVRALKRNSSSIAVIKRLFTNIPSLFNNIEWIEGDVNDLFSIEEAMKDVDTVYHSAAFISFNSSDRGKMMKINVEGTANMVNMALKTGVKRFCHFSSVAAMGRDAEKSLIDETSWWKTSRQNSNYAISKYGGEREVWRGIEEGLSAFIVNPTIIIGGGNWISGSTQMFSQVWKGLPFYTTGITGFVDVRDVTKAALMLMDKGISNERFIVNSENVSYRFVFDSIAESLGRRKARYKVNKLLSEIGWRAEKVRGWITGKNPMITKETARNGLMIWQYSNDKLKKEIGIDFIPVRQSIEDTSRLFLRDTNSQ